MANTLQERSWVRGGRQRPAKTLLIFAAVLLSTLIATLSAQAQTFTVLYSFKGEADGDGTGPSGALVRDAAGNLYGTTFRGGLGTSPGNGTAFRLDASGHETVLYRFGSHAGDGTNPSSGLLQDGAGNLYGTTLNGGAFGLGTVFKLNEQGMTVLHSFSGNPDGKFPGAALFRLPEPDGMIYGTTAFGGANDYGTVFSLDKSGNETVVHSFTAGDSGGPGDNLGALLRAPGQGILRLYATTEGVTYGPPAVGHGEVYEIASTGNARVLHRFAGGTGGAGPIGGLILDATGSLYGTTAFGGLGLGGCGFGGLGCGVLFKIDINANYSVLHRFTEGQNRESQGATLVMDAAGNLYGITEAVMFKLDTFGNYSVLQSFTGANGTFPSSLLLGADGNVYGNAAGGGAFGSGVVFKLVP
jgi:uncharacterized repeat protein (TIGR03803 family)